MRNIIILLLLFPVALEAQTLSIWGVENDTVEIGKNIKTNKWIANMETGVIYQLSHAVTKTQTLSSVGDSGGSLRSFRLTRSTQQRPTQHLRLLPALLQPRFTG